MLLDHESRMLATLMQRAVAQKKQRFAHLAAALDAMSPLKVLGRGYSVTLKENGQLVKSVKAVKCGDSLTVRMSDGKLTAKVQEVFE